jgi:repressor LexA
MISGEPLNGRDLTPVQRQVHRFIEDFAQRHGYPPSYREIGDAVGLASLSSVALHVQTLQKKGYLSHEPGRPRTAVARSYGSSADRKETDGAVPIELAPQTAVRVRLVGRIAAGEPILPGELSDDPLADDTYLLPTRLVGEGTLFMLRVAGDSMIGAGIADGDLVVIRQQPDAENGDIVAVRGCPGLRRP